MPPDGHAPLLQTRRIACGPCGSPFDCTPGACWCDAVPVRQPLTAAAADCFCPACLARLVAAGDAEALVSRRGEKA